MSGLKLIGELSEIMSTGTTPNHSGLYSMYDMYICMYDIYT